MNQNILLQASDWDFRFDLGSEPLQFPTEVAATTLRPDVVIYSRTKKIVIMLELTVPLEDPLIFLANILCVHVRKSDEMYASPTWCTHAKNNNNKNTTELTVFGIHDLTLRNGAIIAWGPPMCSPLFLPKESSHEFSVVFVNVMYF